MYVWRFVCCEIIRLNQRLGEILLVNVLRKVKNILTFLLVRKSPFKPSISVVIYKRSSCFSPLTTLKHLKILFQLMSGLYLKLCPEWRVGKIATMLIYNHSLDSLLTDLSLSRRAGKSYSKKLICRLPIFFFAKRLSWRSCGQILPFISNKWYIKRNKTMEISNEL